MDPGDVPQGRASRRGPGRGLSRRLESYRVVPELEPGAIRERLPVDPPARPEPLDLILDDYSG